MLEGGEGAAAAAAAAEAKTLSLPATVTCERGGGAADTIEPQSVSELESVAMEMRDTQFYRALVRAQTRNLTQLADSYRSLCGNNNDTSNDKEKQKKSNICI